MSQSQPHPQPRPHPTVSEFLSGVTLPDPTIPVPFERFSSLKENPDMLVRAAFWCFYAAWQQEHIAKDFGTMLGTATLPTEARNDGHMLRAITQELSVRDAVIVTRRYLHILESPRAPYLVTYGAMFAGMGIALLMGLMAGWLTYAVVVMGRW